MKSFLLCLPVLSIALVFLGAASEPRPVRDHAGELSPARVPSPLPFDSSTHVLILVASPAGGGELNCEGCDGSEAVPGIPDDLDVDCPGGEQGCVNPAIVPIDTGEPDDGTCQPNNSGDDCVASGSCDMEKTVTIQWPGGGAKSCCSEVWVEAPTLPPGRTRIVNTLPDLLLSPSAECQTEALVKTNCQADKVYTTKTGGSMIGIASACIKCTQCKNANPIE